MHVQMLPLSGLEHATKEDGRTTIYGWRVPTDMSTNGANIRTVGHVYYKAISGEEHASKSEDKGKDEESLKMADHTI